MEQSFLDYHIIITTKKIIIYTLIAIISKQRALNWVSSQLESMDTDSNVVNISKRKVELYPFPPPGMDKVITGK